MPLSSGFTIFCKGGRNIIWHTPVKELPSGEDTVAKDILNELRDIKDILKEKNQLSYEP